MTQAVTEMSKFHQIIKNASKVVVLSGAGISAESGIPTFRGSGGLWRSFRSTDLATPSAFRKSPSLVWEFYHYRRELVMTKQPNKAHIAIADAEKKLADSGKKLTVITQNVDGLHQRAGSKNVIELHGNLYKTRCTQCGQVLENTNSPIAPALENRGTRCNTKSFMRIFHTSQRYMNMALPFNSNGVVILRHYCSSPRGGEKTDSETAKDAKEKTLSLKDKLKFAVRDYGSTVLVFHISHSLTLLGIIYLALSSGIDVKWLLQNIGMGESNVTAGASTFVAAYAINKVLAPVRMSITLAGTPLIVRYLRKIGLLKTPVKK